VSEQDHRVIEHPSTLPASIMLHPIVEKMLAKDPTPETLEKILTIQREFEKDSQKRAYTEALVALKKDLPAFIKRDKAVDFTSNEGRRTQYNHASLANVLDIVNPKLEAHGFSLTFKPDVIQGVVHVKARLTHHAGHSEEATLTAAPDTRGNKNPAQAVGSTMTALERYAALALLGIATADMDDESPATAPAPEADKVDVAINIKAMGKLAGKGLKKEDVEKLVGRPVQEWTTADIDMLRAKYFPTAAPAPAATAPREPGADEGEDLGVNLEFHCTTVGCGYHSADESLFIDHQEATGHRQQAPANQKPKGGRSK